MQESEFETNGLTMKLLGLAHYCEGRRAAEIQAVIARLPVAAYNERTAAENEIARLRRENEELKYRLSTRDIGTPSSVQRRPAQFSRAPRRGNTPVDRTSGPHIKEEERLSISSSSTSTMARNPRLTPPAQHQRDMVPADAKRQRTDSALSSRRPVCTGCFQVNGLCDAKVECDVCRARGYGCEYRECWDGLTCIDLACTRIHPDQWDPVRETGRKVNQSRNGVGSWR
ncbi:uncharacterized protein RCC_04556 [Ramularia collo-cygni]|uniref:Uncharacterized protein n=1 Tax=Ramularia collo-cygni TaxID=112498 RepID=A0A2D3UPW8_9PEZI|nr:uncharacterized protein RCC_04556 [Ramularia collo-cygni]CZT18712.1 uncharacterized protein RCC_04556 [Ramularia collo-cygni]